MTIAPSGKSLPTALPKDPQPSVDRIEELARRIVTGDIYLPKFQRRFVWEPGQVLTLLDSVARGWPVGSILLWQSKQELRSENKIADLDIALPKPDYPVNYLLDGQQRLSTICGALFWKGADPKSLWNLAYDLRETRFLHLTTLDEPPLHQVRVNKLSDPAAYFKHVSALDTSSSPDRADLKVRAEQLFSRFKDYKIATVTLGDMSIQDVAPIFERINSQGTPLTIVDLMRAATWSPDFDLVDSIDNILQDLSEKKFEAIERGIVLRNLSASINGGFSVESIDALRKHSADILKKGSEEVREAYKSAVDFLVTQVKIPDANVLPYANQMTVLVEIFRTIRSPTAAQFQAITRWFWKTALAGYFGGWSTGDMSRDHKAIQEFASGSKSEIEFGFKDPGPEVWRTRQFRSNSAHSKLLAILLSQAVPKDLLTGQQIDTSKALSWKNQKEFHHFFPRDYLARRGLSSDRVNVLANFVMLTSVSNKAISARAPSVYLKDVANAAGSELDSWLSSNLISQEAYAAALADNYDKFLECRIRTIQSAVLKHTT